MIDWAKISLEELAGYLSEELRKSGIEVILVGGACVTIYSQNRYQSYDLDFVTYEDMKIVKKALNNLGFFEKEGYFQHKSCEWFVEFVSAPVAIGNELITQFEHIEMPTGTIKMLRVEDSVKDRLASYFHWNDRQGLEQALAISKDREYDLDEIKNWAIKEGFQDKLSIFLERKGEIA